MKTKNLYKNFIEKYNTSIFAITKLIFLIWTIFLAGALDHFKSQIIKEYGDSLLIYTCFWLLLTSVAFLFNSFLKVKNLKEIEVIFERLQYGVMYPLMFVYGLLFLTLALFFTRFDKFAMTLMFFVPISISLLLNWKEKFDETLLLESLKKYFISK